MLELRVENTMRPTVRRYKQEQKLSDIPAHAVA
jgi:hypothetical protein